MSIDGKKYSELILFFKKISNDQYFILKDKCAKSAAEAISKVNGTIYTVGPTTATVGK